MSGTMDESLFGEATEVENETIHDQEFEPLEEEPFHGSAQSQFREEFPSGLHWLFDSTSRIHLIDFAIENAHSNETYTKSALAENVGPSRKTIHEHLPDLVEAGIYEEIGDGNPRYRPNAESNVLIAASVLNDNIVRTVK